MISRSSPSSPEAGNPFPAARLSISPELGGRTVPVRSWLRDAGRTGGIPFAFLHGGNDEDGAAFARRCLRALEPGRDDQTFTAVRAVEGTESEGAGLLRTSLPTVELIRTYVRNLLKGRWVADRSERGAADQTFFWALPGRRPQLAKLPGEKRMHLLPLQELGVP